MSITGSISRDTSPADNGTKKTNINGGNGHGQGYNIWQGKYLRGIMRTLISIVLAALLLLPGCAMDVEAADEPVVRVPGEIVNQTVATGPPLEEKEPEVKVNESLEEKPPEGVTCSITLKPTTIYMDESTKIDYMIYSPGKTEFTFLCGKNPEKISTGGLVTGTDFASFLSLEISQSG